MQLKAFLSILSFLDILGIIGVLTWGALDSVPELVAKESGWQTSLIAFSILSGIGLIYTMYAAIWGKYVAKVALSIIFVLYDLLSLFYGISILAVQNRFVDIYKKAWDNAENNSKYNQYVFDLEERYQCCGFSDPLPETKICSTFYIRCGIIIKYEINVYVFIMAMFLLILFVVMSILIILACFSAYSVKEEDEYSENKSLRWIKPLAYGF